MKFTFNGVEYRIGFQYENRKTGRKKVRNYCTARIETGDERDNTFQIVTQGTVVRFAYDKFVKEEARQYALEKALDNSAATFGIGNQKSFCSAARKAYHNRPGGLGAHSIPNTVAVASPVIRAGDTLAPGLTVESIRISKVGA
jgi:hypothetical protein